jgi:hypothetical protein
VSRARTRAAITLIVAATAALAATPAAQARDRDPGGTVGYSHNFVLHGQLGGLNNDVLGDRSSATPYANDGSASFFRMRGGGYLDSTHSGHLVAIEATFGMGWFNQSALVRPSEDPMMPTSSGPPPTWGRLFLDFDLTMLVDVIRIQDNRWIPPGKLAFLGGFGVSTDFAYFYMGGRGAGALGNLEVELEYQYRFGESHSDPPQREERIHLYIYYGKFGVGFETWHGWSEDADGLAASDRVFKGGYSATLFNLMWVIK